MSRYDLAVFDFDGTLADSADWLFGSLNEAAERFGFRTTTDDERQALRRLGNREIIRRLQVPTWKLPAIARHMRRKAAENIDSIGLFRGVPEAYAAVPRGDALSLLAFERARHGVIFSFFRRAATEGTRRTLDNCAFVAGRQSGSESAAR